MYRTNTDGTASVVYYTSEVPAVLVIPSTFDYNDETYGVTSISKKHSIDAKDLDQWSFPTV